MKKHTSQTAAKSGGQASVIEDATSNTASIPSEAIPTSNEAGDARKPKKRPASKKSASADGETEAACTDAPPDATQPSTSLEVMPAEAMLGAWESETESALADLTPTEQQDLERCEAVIQQNKKSFLETCKAMSEICTKRLYKREYGSFREYCAKRWSFCRSYGYRLAKAQKTIEKVSTIVDTSASITNGSQVEELDKVPEEKRPEVLEAAKRKAGAGKMTRRHIKEAAREAVVEEAEVVSEQEPPPPAKAETSKPTEVESEPEPTNVIPTPATPPAKGMVWVQLPADYHKDADPFFTLQQLSEKAKDLDCIRSDSSKKPAMGTLMFQIKMGLALYAEWEQKCLSAASAKQEAA